jgi:hypothetical protein
VVVRRPVKRKSSLSRGALLFASENFQPTISNSRRRVPIFVRQFRQWSAGFITIGHGEHAS